MAIDMIGLALKGMGFDPVAIQTQATELVALFVGIKEALAFQADAMARIEANQLAVMSALGLEVPMPDEAALILIAQESRRFIEIDAAVVQ